MKQYKHLSLEERERIYLYLGQGKSSREIGRLMRRNHRTIAREIKRNQSAPAPQLTVGRYSPSVAQHLADQKRQKAKMGVRKLDDPALQHYVIKQLGRHWSPEQIAGRLGLKVPDLAISHETIYQFIYAKENRRLRLWELLRKRHSRRQTKHGRKAQKAQIPGRVFIEYRSDEANLRLKVGHWETDNMEGTRATKDCASAVVDRKSGLVRIAKLKSKKAQEKEAALINQLGKFPDRLVKTITYDNGSENHHHQTVARRLNCQSFFCHPYHSWEKGSVENTIGLVREYLPKGTDLSTVTQGGFSWIAWQLNNRPRKRHGYYTPSEIFEKETGWVT